MIFDAVSAVLIIPAVAAALSLTMVVILVLVSRLKHEIISVTANFLDVMIIDQSETSTDSAPKSARPKVSTSRKPPRIRPD